MAARSRYCSGRTPVTIASRSGSSSGEASTPPLRMRSILVCSSMSEKLSRSEVATTVWAPSVGAWAATLASTSSASSPSGTTTHDAEVAEHLDREVELALEALGLGRPLGLVGRPPPLAAAVAAVVEPDHDRVGADPVDRGRPAGSAARAPPTPARRRACGTSCAPTRGRPGAATSCRRRRARSGWTFAATLSPRRPHATEPRRSACREPARLSRRCRGPGTRWRRTLAAASRPSHRSTGRRRRAFGRLRPCAGSGCFGVGCPARRSASGPCLGALPSAACDRLGDLLPDQLGVGLVGVEDRRHDREGRDLLVARLEGQADEPVDLAGRDARLHHGGARLGDLLEVLEHVGRRRAGRASRPSRTSAAPSASSRRSPSRARAYHWVWKPVSFCLPGSM